MGCGKVSVLSAMVGLIGTKEKDTAAVCVKSKVYWL